MDFFGIGIMELLVILAVAMLVLGPEQLPQMANKLGGLLQKARTSVAETRDAFLVDLDVKPSDGGDSAPEQHGHTPIGRDHKPQL
ncbi:MAG: mttA/Hcf106 family [Dehalococcoidia bacterium]|nr:mttA/Hcf106 family [Dehalococcoidia bacterium]